MELSSSSSRSGDAVFLGAALAVVAFMGLFFNQSKAYDLATAAFFAFGLGLMVREKLSEYFALFAFACVNRETAFLLTMVFAIYYGIRGQGLGVRWIGLGVLYQVFIFLVVRSCVMVIFAVNDGVEMLVRPWQNVQLFLADLPASAIHWGAFAVVIWLCVRRWKAQPLMLRVAFAVLMPALTGMYLVLGYSFEVRVFAEVFPVAWVMMNAEGRMLNAEGVK